MFSRRNFENFKFIWRLISLESFCWKQLALNVQQYRVTQHLFNYKYYLMPLLFFVSFVTTGALPGFIQPLGGERRVKSVCIGFALALIFFMLISITFVFSIFLQISRIFQKYSAFVNKTWIFFSIPYGRITSRFFWKFTRFFMVRYRAAVGGTNSLGEVIGVGSFFIVFVNAFGLWHDSLMSRLVFALRFFCLLRWPITKGYRNHRKIRHYGRKSFLPLTYYGVV